MKRKIILAVVCCALLIFAWVSCQADQKPRVIGEIIETTIKDGIKIELSAIVIEHPGTRDTQLNTFLVLEDLTDNRLDGDVYVDLFIGNRRGGGAFLTRDVLSRIDDNGDSSNRVSMDVPRYSFGQLVRIQDVYFIIERIYYTNELESDSDAAISDTSAIEIVDEMMVIELGWTVSHNEMYLVADGLNIEYEGFIIREIKINPFALLLIVESGDIGIGHNDYESYIRIITENGVLDTTFRAGWHFSGFFADYSSREAYSFVGKDFLDLDSVIAIEIGEEVIELR